MAKAPELNVTVGLDAATRMLGEVANRVDEIRAYIADQLQPFALSTFPEQRWAFIVRGKDGRTAALSFQAASVMDAYLLFMADGGPAGLAGDGAQLLSVSRICGEGELSPARPGPNYAAALKPLEDLVAAAELLERAADGINEDDSDEGLLVQWNRTFGPRFYAGFSALTAALKPAREAIRVAKLTELDFSGPGGPEKDPLVSLGQGEYRQDYPPKPPAVGTNLDTQA